MPLRDSRLGRAAVVTAAVTPGPSPIAKAAVVGAAVSGPGPAPVAKAAVDDPAAALKSFIARQPMGRFGKAEEIAATAVYLASDDAAFVTGQTFVVDGGWTI